MFFILNRAFVGANHAAGCSDQGGSFNATALTEVCSVDIDDVCDYSDQVGVTKCRQHVASFPVVLYGAGKPNTSRVGPGHVLIAKEAK